MTSLSEFPGNILVVRDGQVGYEASNGPADPVAGTPLTPRSRFQIASISKQFTAAATLKLVDAGKLSVDDKLSHWIAGSPESWAPITIHHLLSNSSGIGHWPDYPELDLTETAPIDELIKAFQRREVFCEPGSRFRYSSPGFGLLAHIVELASETPYRDFLHREIFAPLGMSDTFSGNGGDRPGLAVGCGPDGPLDKLFELDFIGRGAGDIWSTARDLVTWNEALADGRVLGERSCRLTFTPQVFSERYFGEDQYYGYGWFVGALGGRAVRYHTGDNAGFNALSFWFPELSTYVVVLTNINGYFLDAGEGGVKALIAELLDEALAGSNRQGLLVFRFCPVLG